MKHTYDTETQEKWGHTTEYAISKQRTSQYTPADWTKIQQEAQDIFQAFHAALGTDCCAPPVQNLVRRWQTHITTYYYPCSVEILENLGMMYIADARFRENIDGISGIGTAHFMHEAIDAFCLQAWEKSCNGDQVP
jgi:hypothetical protein